MKLLGRLTVRYDLRQAMTGRSGARTWKEQSWALAFVLGWSRFNVEALNPTLLASPNALKVKTFRDGELQAPFVLGFGFSASGCSTLWPSQS